MSKFALVMEELEAGDLDTASKPNTSQLQNAELLAAATEEFDDIKQQSDVVDKISDAEKDVLEIKDIVQPAADNEGLSLEALGYLHKSMSNILGYRYTARRLPSMESAQRYDKVAVAKVALEGIKDTLREFWTAIKNQTTKFWNMTKSWYIKTFDVGNKIIARAKALQEKTNQMTSTPNEKTFNMGSVTMLAVNYQVKEPNTCIKGLESLKDSVDSLLTQITKVNQADKSDAILNTVETMLVKIRSEITKNAADVSKVSTDLGTLIFGTLSEKPSGDAQTDEEMAKKIGVPEGEQFEWYRSPSLPGNKNLFVIRIKNAEQLSTTATDLDKLAANLDLLKQQRKLLGDSSAKPKEMGDDLDVKVLTSAQVDQIASYCLDMGEVILKYKKEFEARDRFFQKVTKGFDRIMKDLESADVTHPTEAPKAPKAPEESGTTSVPTEGTPPADAGKPVAHEDADSTEPDFNKANDKVDKMVRKIAQYMLGDFKKTISMCGTILTHSIKVCDAFLTYGERSAAQYGG